MAIEIFKFENRTSDGEKFLPIGRDDSPVYFVLYDIAKCWKSIRLAVGFLLLLATSLSSPTFLDECNVFICNQGGCKQ